MKFIYLIMLIVHSESTETQPNSPFNEELLDMVDKKPSLSTLTPSQAEQQIPDTIKPETQKEEEQPEEIEKEIPDVIKEDPQQKESDSHGQLQSFLATKTNDDTIFGKFFRFPDEMPEDDLKELSKDETLQKLMKEFQALDCKGDYKEMHKASNYTKKSDKIEEPAFCSAKIKDLIFENLETVDYSPTNLYHWMTANLFKPLGYKIYPKYTFPDVLNSFMDVTKKESMIHAEMQIPNNRDFKRMVVKTFETIENASSDFQNNKGQISNIVIDLLKKFHIYWNVHRQRKHMEHLHQNTISVVDSVLQKYKETSNSMKAITLHIIKNIKDAYLRFQRAHSMFKVVKKHSAEMIAVQILKRVKNNYQKIHMKHISYDQMVTELSYILDMLNGFFLVNYKSKVDETKNKQMFKQFIFEKIKDLYESYSPFFKKSKGKEFYDFKDWTVTLLLKMQLKVQIDFNIYGLPRISNEPAFQMKVGENIDENRIYYEFKDMMMIVPSYCEGSLRIDLQRCVESEIFEVIKSFYYKYHLYASVSGANFMSYLKQQKNNLVKFIQHKRGFDNYNNFRNLYFAELFKITRKLKAKYKIKEWTNLSKIESIIGKMIKDYKTRDDITAINMNLINKLDQEFYEDMLDIKAKFSTDLPIKNNYVQIQQIKHDMIHSFIDFYRDNKSQFNTQSSEILKVLINQVDSFWESLLKQNKNKLNTPGSSYIPFLKNHSTYVSNYVHEPSFSSMKSIPMHSI